MILTCQNCSTSFRLEERLLKPSGSKVRCSRCKHIWRAHPPEAPDTEPESPSSLEGQLDHGAAAAGLAAGAGLATTLASDDQDAVETPPAPTEDPGPPELKLGWEEPPALETDEDDDLVTDEINLDELDLLLEDEPPPAGTEVEDDFKTEELNLADLEKMLDSDVGDDAAAPAVTADTPGVDDINAFQEETDENIIEDLDLDMDDLESLLEEDKDLGDGLETPAPGEATPEPVEDEVKLDLAPELEDLLEDDVEEVGIEETEEIGLSEVEETDPGMTDAAAPDDGAADDIDLQLAPGIDSLFDEVEDKDIPLEETEELDFASLGLEDRPADQAPSEAAEEPDEMALELDLDDGPEGPPVLEEESPTQVQPPEGEDQLPLDDEAAELDLGDLEGILETDAAEPAKLSPGEEQPELVLELEGDTDEPAGAEEMDLALDDLDLGAPEPAETGEIEETRELDLDELESLLDDGEATPAEAPPPETPEIEGLELDLDLDAADDEGMEPDEATRELNLDDIEKILESQDAAPAIDEGAADDLELDLDLGDEAAPTADEAALLGENETTEGSDSLDLSDLEKMLDVEDTTDSPSPTTDTGAEELELDFDLQPATDEGDDLELEFDMLEDEGEEASALFDTSESEDLGLDLDIGDSPAPEKVELEEDLEFEIMDEDGGDELDLELIEDDAGGGDELDLDLLEDNAKDLDLDILEDGAEDFELDIVEDDDAAGPGAMVETAALGASGAAASRDLTQELMDEMAAADTQTMDVPPSEVKPIKPAPIPARKKTSKSLLLLLLLVLLGAGGYFLYDKTGFDFSKFKLSDLPEIPFVSKWLGAEKAPEAVVPVETSLKGNWVQNNNDGRLYVIQGRVKNEYSEPRSFIRVTGRIFADGRKFKMASQAYCGNMPSHADLENLPLAELQKRLGNRSGANNLNVKVAPGKEVPFTVIFADLPEDVELQEYAVEISGSLPVTPSQSK